MEWMNAVLSAIEYIEDNITENITAEDAANHVYTSSSCVKGL